MIAKVLAFLLSSFCLSAIADYLQTHSAVWAKDGTQVMSVMVEKPTVSFTVVGNNKNYSFFNLMMK